MFINGSESVRIRTVNGPEGDSHIKMTGGRGEVKMCRLVPLWSKIITVRIIAVPFRVMSRKNMTQYDMCCLK